MFDVAIICTTKTDQSIKYYSLTHSLTFVTYVRCSPYLLRSAGLARRGARGEKRHRSAHYFLSQSYDIQIVASRLSRLVLRGPTILFRRQLFVCLLLGSVALYPDDLFTEVGRYAIGKQKSLPISLRASFNELRCMDKPTQVFLYRHV